VDRRRCSGTKRTVSIRENIESVQELVLNQESQVTVFSRTHCICSSSDEMNLFSDIWNSVSALPTCILRKIVLFKVYCTPMYGCQLWSSSFQYSLNKLKVAYNDGFRLLLNEPRWCSASSLFVYHNVPTFDALIRKLIYALWRSCHHSSNVLVDKLFASDIYFESKLFKRWRQLLY